MGKVTKVEKIWFDGKLVNWDDAQVHVLTYGLHYGLGVFEGIRCYEGNGKSAIFRLKEHIDRLFDSAKINRIEIPFTREQIMEACKEVLRVNKLKSAYLRPLVFVGDGEMGLVAFRNPVRVMIAAWSWGSYLGDDGINNGIRAKISSYSRYNVNGNMTRAKTCGSYINSILAKQEALSGGYEEALLLDAEGYLAEATGENIFIVRNGVVYTPGAGSSILLGITRDTLMTLLAEQGIVCKETRITRDEAYIADEIFLCGTAAELTPIRELDDRVIGTGKPGPITKKLQEIYFGLIRGKTETHKEWLAYL